MIFTNRRDRQRVDELSPIARRRGAPRERDLSVTPSRPHAPGARRRTVAARSRLRAVRDEPMDPVVDRREHLVAGAHAADHRRPQEDRAQERAPDARAFVNAHVIVEVLGVDRGDLPSGCVGHRRRLRDAREHLDPTARAPQPLENVEDAPHPRRVRSSALPDLDHGRSADTDRVTGLDPHGFHPWLHRLIEART